MNGSPSTTSRRRAVALACLAAVHGGALAAGFQLSEQSVSGLGAAFAGQAALADDASVVFFNPAGLTRLGVRRQAVVAGHIVQPKGRFHDGGSCTPYLGTGAGTTACPFGPSGNLGHGPGNDGGEADDTGFVPNAYLAWELMPGRLWGGLGLNAPFGLKTTRDAAWIGRFHATESEVQGININPTLAYKVMDNLSVGAGFNAMRFSADLSNAVSYRAVALASGVPALAAAIPAGAEGIATVEGDDWGYGWNLGVQFEPVRGLQLGATYRSAIKFSIDGDVRFGNRPAALAAVPALADGRVGASVELPDTVSLAVAWEARPGLKLLFDWTRTGWDSIQDLTVVREEGPLAEQTVTSTALRFRDSWRAGVGVVWDTPQWTLRAGFAHETSPVTDDFRTPRLADTRRRWYAVGGRWKMSPDLHFDVGLALLRFRDAPSRLPNQETPTSAPRGSLVGEYTAKAYIVGAQANWSF